MPFFLVTCAKYVGRSSCQQLTNDSMHQKKKKKKKEEKKKKSLVILYWCCNWLYWYTDYCAPFTVNQSPSVYAIADTHPSVQFFLPKKPEPTFLLAIWSSNSFSPWSISLVRVAFFPGQFLKWLSGGHTYFYMVTSVGLADQGPRGKSNKFASLFSPAAILQASMKRTRRGHFQTAHLKANVNRYNLANLIADGADNISNLPLQCIDTHTIFLPKIKE